MNMIYYDASRRTKYKFLTMCIFLASICEFSNKVYGSDQDVGDFVAKYLHHTVVNMYYHNRRGLPTSNLGTILFKNIDPEIFNNSVRQAKTYKIAVWVVWTDIIASYLRGATFDSQSVTDEVLEQCSVKNCVYYSSYAAVDLEPADAVIFTTQMNRLPIKLKRNPQQRWILWSRGHPAHKTSRWTQHGLNMVSGFFNWTMSYRTDSDIPVPFGRTIPLSTPIEIDYNNLEGALAKLVPYWQEKQTGTLAMTIIDKCKWEYKEFSKYFNIDIYWKSCPIVAKADCKLPEQYLFYVVFEDSSCRQYISETVFHHAYSKGAIPLIIGTPLQDCEKLLPPNSFIHVEQYQNMSDLVITMKEISSNYGTLLKYHKWRQHFAVTNEHGIYDSQSLHLCRVCEALNYNDGAAKWYNIEELSLFYNEKLFCDFIHECRN